MKKNKIFFVVCLLMFVGGLAVGGNYFLKQKENENIYEKVREEKKVLPKQETKEESEETDEASEAVEIPG